MWWLGIAVWIVGAAFALLLLKGGGFSDED